MSDEFDQLKQHKDEILAKENAAVLRVGDKMRFSLELIEDIKAQPDQTSELVKVNNITTDDDGVKCVWMERA